MDFYHKKKDSICLSPIPDLIFFPLFKQVWITVSSVHSWSIYVCFIHTHTKGLSNHKYTHLSLDALMTPLSTISLSWSSRYMITFPPQLDMASRKEVPLVVTGAAHTYSYLCVCMRVCDSQLCLALCDCMDCSCQAPLCLGITKGLRNLHKTREWQVGTRTPMVWPKSLRDPRVPALSCAHHTLPLHPAVCSPVLPVGARLMIVTDDPRLLGFTPLRHVLPC